MYLSSTTSNSICSGYIIICLFTLQWEKKQRSHFGIITLEFSMIQLFDLILEKTLPVILQITYSKHSSW